MELEQRVTQVAHLLRHLGVRTGGAVAFSIENSPEFFEIASAAQRDGAIFAPMSIKLSVDERHYIVEDTGAWDFILSASCDCDRHVRREISRAVDLLAVGGEIEGFGDWTARRKELPLVPSEPAVPGREMMYSSGTTGRPKGVRKPLPTGELDDPDSRAEGFSQRFAVNEGSVYLSTSPLYHSAPYVFAASALRYGATCSVMEYFKAELALPCSDNFRCTHGISVPTMFHRMLKLPPEIRSVYNTGSLRYAVHGAAPCPVHVKEEMIDWWGPIL